MAQDDLVSDVPADDWFATQPPPSSSSQFATEQDRQSYIESQLRAAGGDLYDPTDLAGVNRNSSYARNADVSLDDFINNQKAIYAERASNVPGGHAEAAPAGAGNNWGSPNSIQAFNAQFHAPTLAELQATPGYQSRLKAGADVLGRSAAAHGTLLTGGTLKDLNAYAQDFASNEYAQEYARDKGEYDTAFQIQQANEANRYNSQRTNLLDQRSFYDTDRSFNRQTGLDAWNQNLDQFNMANTVENNTWNHASQLANWGYGAAANGANAAAGYGQQATGLITGAGNSAAAGAVGAGNAWGQTLGNLGNTAANLYAYNRSFPTATPNHNYWATVQNAVAQYPR